MTSKINASVYEFSFNSIDGKEINLNNFKGKPIFIVNTASLCGFTYPYSDIETLYQKYKKAGVVIIGIPSNDFGNQEPDSLEEIKTFCSTKYGVKFEIMDKIHAKGNTSEPYTTLNKFEPEGDVEWNFEKFLVGRDSNVIARFKPSTKPFDDNLIAAIEVALDS